MERLNLDPSKYCTNCNFKEFYGIDFNDDFKLQRPSCQFARQHREFLLGSGVDSVVYKSEYGMNVIKIYPYLSSRNINIYKSEIDRVSRDLSGKKRIVGQDYNLVFIPIDKIYKNRFGNRCIMAVSHYIEYPNFAEYRRKHPDTPDLLIPIEDMFTRYYKKQVSESGRKLTWRFNLNDMNFKLDDKTNTIYFTDIASSISVFLHIYVGV
jgi:hypothetical protein